jgi:acetylglutamate kinase
MIFLTDQDGILDAEGRVISELDAGELEQLIEQSQLAGGMLDKATTILHALKNGVEDLHVLNAGRPHCVIEELFTSLGAGTLCRKRSRTRATSGGAK